MKWAGTEGADVLNAFETVGFALSTIIDATVSLSENARICSMPGRRNHALLPERRRYPDLPSATGDDSVPRKIIQAIAPLRVR
jgi:hypothetical protein